MKILVLQLLKKIGIFALFRFINRNKTMMLSYHAVAVADETDFRRQLFIRPETLTQRLAHLQKYYQVIPLAELSKTDGQLQHRVILTLNDGWYPNYKLAAPLLADYQLAYTVYLTGEQSPDQQPIFHVCLSYILTMNIGKRFQYQHASGVDIDEVLTRERVDPLIELIEPTKDTSIENDTPLLLSIAASLDFDLQPTIDNRVFNLVSSEEAQRWAQLGADLQMHTHTHDTPLDSLTAFTAKLTKNRDYIESLTGKKPMHYSYPVGIYQPQTVEYLRRMEVCSARTTNAGLISQDTPPLELPSFADSENIPQIVFEAQLCGIMPLVQRLING